MAIELNSWRYIAPRLKTYFMAPFQKRIQSSFMRSFKLMWFSAPPVVWKCAENLHESICNPFKISCIFAHMFWEKPVFAHTVDSKGFTDTCHFKFPCYQFCVCGIFTWTVFCLSVFEASSFQYYIKWRSLLLWRTRWKAVQTSVKKTVNFSCYNFRISVPVFCPSSSGTAVVYSSLVSPKAFSFISVFSLQKCRCSESCPFI